MSNDDDGGDDGGDYDGIVVPDFVFDDDQKKKIASTEFVYICAPSGVGKTFSGDYLEAIMGWKHIDGDTPLKSKNSSKHYTDLADRLFKTGKYDFVKKLPQKEKTEWILREGYHAYMTELARLALLGAQGNNHNNNKVVLTHASYMAPQRLFFRNKLVEGGADPRNITMIFLHCDRNVHDAALWKRWQFQVEVSAYETLEEFFANVFNLEGISDFESFVENFQEKTLAFYNPPAVTEEPYSIVNVTARDTTVLDSIDAVLGLDSSNRKELSYDAISKKIKAIDQERDRKWSEDHVAKLDPELDKEEIDVATKAPETYAHRRSTLLAADMTEAIRRVSVVSTGTTGGVSTTATSRSSSSSSTSTATESVRRKSRQSFIVTGKL